MMEKKSQEKNGAEPDEIRRRQEQHTVAWMLSVPGRRSWYLVLECALRGLHGASGVFYALFLKKIVDAAANHDREGFLHGVVWIILLVAGQLLIRALLRRMTELMKSGFENSFKARLTGMLLKKDYLHVNAVHSGEWMNRLTNDTLVVANGLVDIVPGLVEMLVKLFSAVIMIIALEPRFALLIVPGGLAMVGVTWLFRKFMKQLHKKVQEADGEVRIFLQERIGNMLMLRSFAAEDLTMAGAEEKMKWHRAQRMRRNWFSNISNLFLGTAIQGTYLLGVFWCGYGILMGRISFGTLTAITQLISQIQMPFANISGYLPQYYAMQASAERLMEVENFPEDETKALSREEIITFYRERFSALGLRDAGFTYFPVVSSADELTKDEMPAVLENISLRISKGEYVAFTGQSGCGKSTVLKLLMCVFSPDRGERYYLDRKGKENLLTSAYRRLFAYVPQGNQLMSGTIRDVVSYAFPEAAEDEGKLWQALKIACADTFVAELENGLDTLLGERGTGLSEGQTQRVAIARAIFSDAPILLLDESTSALDEGTEKQLLENLRLLTDRTVIIVTHRPAVLSICDRVLKFSENKVEEEWLGV